MCVGEQVGRKTYVRVITCMKEGQLTTKDMK